MAKGERVIAISNFIADRARSRYNVGANRLRVIPRGVDVRQFDPAAVSPHRLARLTSEWCLPPGVPLIMLPARLTRWKGHVLTLDALAQSSRSDTCLVMVGAEQGRKKYRKELIARAAHLGMSERVRLVGHCEDMPAALMLADVVVNPSIEPEPFGRTVIEAQAMGRPIIVSDQGGTAETVEHGVTGWRVQPGDAAALAKAIDYLLDLSTHERAELGLRARKSVLNRYTTEAMQDATIKVYRELFDWE